MAKIKLLLSVIAAVEALAGIGLIIFPTMIVSMLIGTLPEGAVAATLARIAGSALITLAIACWLLRGNAASNGIVKAMLFYNFVVTSLLVYASISNKLSGSGLWPAVLLHVSLAIWCFIALGHHKSSKQLV